MLVGEAMEAIGRYEKAEEALYVARGREHRALSADQLAERVTEGLRAILAHGLSGRWRPVADLLCEYRVRGLQYPAGEPCHLFFRMFRKHAAEIGLKPTDQLS